VSSVAYFEFSYVSFQREFRRVQLKSESEHTVAIERRIRQSEKEMQILFQREFRGVQLKSEREHSLHVPTEPTIPQSEKEMQKRIESLSLLATVMQS
jgi:hypothetical protein